MPNGATRPVIRNTSDIFQYIVTNEEINILAAVTMHLISLDLNKVTQEQLSQKNSQQPSTGSHTNLTESELNQIVYNRYDVEMLDRFKKEAAVMLEAYRAAHALDVVLANSFKSENLLNYFDPILQVPKGFWGTIRYHLKAAWFGLLGNGLTLFVGFILAVMIAAHQDQELEKHTVQLVDRMVNYLSGHVPDPPNNKNVPSD